MYFQMRFNKIGLQFQIKCLFSSCMEKLHSENFTNLDELKRTFDKDNQVRIEDGFFYRRDSVFSKYSRDGGSVGVECLAGDNWPVYWSEYQIIIEKRGVATYSGVVGMSFMLGFDVQHVLEKLENYAQKNFSGELMTVGFVTPFEVPEYFSKRDKYHIYAAFKAAIQNKIIAFSCDRNYWKNPLVLF